MKFCTSCGAQIEDNANACPYCGAMQSGAQRAAGAPAQGGYQQMPSYAPAPAKGGLKISIGGIVAAVGYLLILIALFVPMYSYLGVGVPLRLMTTAGSVMGDAAMGWLFYVPLIFVIVGLLCALLSVFTRNKVVLLIVTIFEVLFSVLALIIIVMAKSEFGGVVSLSVGFFMWIIGIVVAFVGMIMDYAGKKRG
ncbi:MAG: zinc-ribbon domain-containing protein [Lachnospiraceae bacterium]|nr:zinc-ribbon domain-containing protein [Lachnospiraceae bacterium]